MNDVVSYHVSRRVRCVSEPLHVGGVGVVIRVDDDAYPIKDETAKEIMTTLHRYFKAKEALKKGGS